ncbi:arginyltransferase [Thiohalocapsa marina]|uniref:Aspartate/glutamate leucyltransferase n=1 Tax=Thiohalocapsa marina TaxID=424902 RepID=A0A5M8FVA2_9GAMM|nr:arginyltransferase [Thiohalocapsa marina]KAA6187742.1 arginyltransferase [Thiohalocapsa marina]
MQRDRIRRGDLQLYLTGEHDCSYIDQRKARTLFVDPLAHIDGARAGWLQQIGFRRSGRHFYRPACRGCQRCVPVRLPVAAFQPNRSQRRNARRNEQALQVVSRPAEFQLAHYRLYERYMRARHGDGDMADDLGIDTYTRFLLAPWGGETRFIELWQQDALVGVAVTDVFHDGLSAVYTFFEPTLQDRGLGIYSVLNQIRIARQAGLDYLYLGYWISDSRKMAYKEGFRPIEAWDGQAWRRFGPGQPLGR